jgi:hypothetical protein
VVPWGGHEHLGVRPLAAPLLAVELKMPPLSMLNINANTSPLDSARSLR